MAKTKEATQDTEAAPTQGVEQQPKVPEKQAGPAPVARTATSAALPPPNGSPPAGRAADLLSAPDDEGSAPGRARMMRAMQGAVGNARVSRMLDTPIQAKLTVGAPGEAYEQEAERVADAAMRMPEPNRPEQEPPARPNAALPTPPAANRSALRRLPEDPPRKELPDRQSVTPANETPRRTPEDQATPGPPGLADGPRREEAVPKLPALQRQAASTAVPEVTPEVESYMRASRGGGQPLSEQVRAFAEPRLGQDFSQVRVHTDTAAAGMSRELGAQAFTHGSDIYFDEGKYDPESSSGKRLLAHELTHTMQQGASAVRTNPETEDIGKEVLGSAGLRTDGDYLASGAPDIQAAWYNFDIPFTDYQFDPSIEGVKTAAGLAKDTVVDAAGAVKEAVVSGFEWVLDQIKELIDAGIEWLSEKFDEIKAFASSAFDRVSTGLSELLGYITSPVTMLMSAFERLDADLLGAAWSALTRGALLVWNGIKTVVSGVLEVGTGLWNTVSGYVSSLFDRVSSIIDSWPFRQLPAFLQSRARSLFNGIRALWDSINHFMADTLERLKAFTNGILQAVESFVQRVLGHAIQAVIDAVRAIREAWQFVQQVAADPEGFIRPILDQVAAKLDAEAPPKAAELGREKMAEAGRGSTSTSVATGVIQRQITNVPSVRSTATSDEVDAGMSSAIRTAWASLNIGEMLSNTFVNMFWPPATIRAIGHEFSELWHKDWANAVDSLFLPRNFVEDPAGFFHDIWSNILVLLEFPLALWRRLNSVLMLLMGYVTIILVVVGFVGGGIAGGGAFSIPAALAGAGAGLELAGAIGMALLFSFFAAEAVSVIKWIVQLRTARQTQAEKDREYVQIAGSLLGMAIAAVLAAIVWLFAELVSAVVRAIKGGGAPEPSVTPPEERAVPPEEGTAPKGGPEGEGKTPTDRAPEGETRPEGETKPGVAPAEGTLTPSEFAELQAIADKYNTEIHVVGSRAAGQGRNINQPDLPVGKGPGTRSDIDVRIDGQVDINSRGGLSNDISNVSNGAGNVVSSGLPEVPTTPPVIKIRPRRSGPEPGPGGTPTPGGPRGPAEPGGGVPGEGGAPGGGQVERPGGGPEEGNPPKEQIKPPTEDVKPLTERPKVTRPPSEKGEPSPSSPGVIEVDSPARLRASDPWYENGEWHWELHDKQSGAVFCHAHVEAVSSTTRPTGGPELTLTPHEAVLPNGDVVNLRSRGFSWTDESLRLVKQAHQKKFGAQPAELSGMIAWKNLANFQREFARIRAANPGMAPQEIAVQAVQRISFGRARVAAGYSDFYVRMSSFGDATLGGQVFTNVPHYVYIEARPTIGARGGGSTP